MADDDGNTALVLTRQPEQTIKLFTTDGIVEIKIIKIFNEKVRLRIVAPQNIRIIRGELRDYPL